jgi:hypothetical protein
MYWLIEKDDQLEVLLNSGYTKAYIEVIPSSHNIHPVENSVSLVYIKPINAPKGYMLCLSHSETLSVSKTGIDRLLEKFEVLYCRDKKETLHYLPLKALVDINIPPHTYIQELKSNINKDKTKYDEFFNSRVSVVFNALERSGLRIHVPRFEQHFHPVNGERVYSQYNLKTLTTRPSNKFKGVNYAALNKENGCRKSFIPSNDILCEIDISAYHPSLSCRLVDYSFPTVDIHDHMAKLYKVSYAKSKELTFKQLYGGVFDNYRHLEFFQKIEEYVGKTWNKFQSDGKIECPVSGFVFSKDRLENMNPQKLFNYLLQNLETSMNVRILWDVLQLIRGKKTKLILYTYDSFLFDFSQDEQDVMENIQDVFNKYKLNIKIKQGYDYDFR